MIISVHALLRYVQRTYHLDVEKIRAEIACRARILNKKITFAIKVTDGEVVRFLEKNHPGVVENSRADLQYYVKDHNESFVYDNMKFIIRDNTLITVWET